MITSGVARAPSSKVESLPVDPLIQEFEAAVKHLIDNPNFKKARIGISVVEVESGKKWASFQERVLLNPASNAKLYTTAASLSLLLPEYRYETSFGGGLKGGIIEGPLLFRGNGDPSLTTQDVWAMVQELKGLGVKQITGDVLLDQSAYDEETVPPAFEQQPNEWAAFRAPISALALNRNTIAIKICPTAISQPAVVSIDPPGLMAPTGLITVRGQVMTTGRGKNTISLSLMGEGGRLTIGISGVIPMGSSPVRYVRRVEDPTLLAGYVLLHELRKANIAIKGGVKIGRINDVPILVRHQSAPLSQLLYAVGKDSDNFYAEMIFKTLGGGKKRHPARSADGSEVVVQWAEKIGAYEQNMILKNGSGLFDANRVSAASLVQILCTAWRDPKIHAEFIAQLSIAGVDGTLRQRLRELPFQRMIRAKTGSLHDVVALSGYVLSPNKKGPVAFSILFNQVEGKIEQARDAADQLVRAIAKRHWR
ncbi:D-alanyl-D-alanine carboxypeptidase/D-alanyl-D-alanine-endopeptidase [Pajaroellobacter abortibovis]|uniref:D-alanyl-D-alanine carboxypeptidase/D-alanyl-D-alanine-endopeptidase n=1 Tax=Pajaroellobacter abortibovis TaxID=1882918 RepID=A0A1L6MXY2_9BACT|nr:D-alanyl-D-alanine carboxypeptidase/D-alanyl-D-alanine-endopeptidase [Pajaroellobacter abortibovis]